MARKILRFDFKVHSIRAGNSVVYVCNPNPEGEYVLWRDVAPLLEEAQAASTNTGSPKLPPLKESLIGLSDIAGTSISYALYQMGAREMYQYLERQLRAGA